MVFVVRVIDKAISELEQWQRIFDPTWFLILRIGDKLIDSELLEGVSGTTSAWRQFDA